MQFSRRRSALLTHVLLLCTVLPTSVVAKPTNEGRALRKELSDALRSPADYEEKMRRIEALRADDTADSAKLLLGLISKLKSRWPTEDKERDRLAKKNNDATIELMSSAFRWAAEEAKKEYDDDVKRLADLGKKRDAEERMIETALDVLSSYGATSTRKALIAKLRGSDKAIRIASIEALSRNDTPELAKQLSHLARDSKSEVRVAVALASGRLEGFSDQKTLVPLATKNPSWAVRAAALHSIANLGWADAVSPLIERLKLEPGRLLADVTRTLQDITGESIGANQGAWSSWWEAQGHELTQRPTSSRKPKEPRPPVRYYGINTPSRRIVFVIDTSDSMNKTLSGKTRKQKEKGDEQRLLTAQTELKRALLNLSPKDRFSVVVYNNIVVRWKTKMVLATPRNIREASMYVDSLYPTGRTNTFEALEAAFYIEGFSPVEMYRSEGVDTIFLLTDGSPSTGRIDDPREIRRQVRIWNKDRQIVIHCVGLGTEHGSKFLKGLATENGGTYATQH